MTPPIVSLGNTYAAAVAELNIPWRTDAAPAPTMVVLNEPLAVDLGLDPRRLAEPDGILQLLGQHPHHPVETIALGYAGHQFGSLSPRLGDGRAVLLGELVTPTGQCVDIHLKGSGRTPFARGGDGKAALGPMLREYIVSEAMAGLGIPSTRALAVIATGERINRDGGADGAVLVRTAASHIRVGTFQYAAMVDRTFSLVDDLVRYSLHRHYPDRDVGPRPALTLLDAVVESQAELVARWMNVGFVHGVMNTDNTTVSGETIDYGPCAFMEAFDPDTVFSSIDRNGRYRYGNQPSVLVWNLARLAETLLPGLADDDASAVGAATDALERFAGIYETRRAELGCGRLGLGGTRTADRQLHDDLLEVMRRHRLDLNAGFRSICVGDIPLAVAQTKGGRADAPVDLVDDVARWSARFAERRSNEPSCERSNPLYVARNHLVEAAIAAAEAGDMNGVHRLVDVLRHPFDAVDGADDLIGPAPDDFGPYRTFCGT